MVRAQIALTGLAAVALGGCTTSDPLNASRSVFYNPLALEIDNGPVGPVCPQGVIRDDACWIDGVAYPLNGRYARALDGRIVRLSREDRRFLRERTEAIRARQDLLESLENGTPLPPDSPALPENQRNPVPPPRGQ